jgi:hypothetical protein
MRTLEMRRYPVLRHTVCLVLFVCLPSCASACAVMTLGEAYEGDSAPPAEATIQVRPDSMTNSSALRLGVGDSLPPVRPLVGAGTAPARAPGMAPGAEAGVPPVFPAARRAVPKPRRLYAGLVFGGGPLSGRDYDGFGTAGLSLGGYPRPRIRVDGTATFSGVAFLPEGALGRAFQDAETAEMGLDLTARYDPLQDQALLRVYPLVGVGAGTMFWNYAKPVTVIQGGAPTAVGHDGIFYFTYFAGLGMALALTPYLTVGGSVTGGTRLYDQSMGSGLKNDLLKPTGFARVLLEVNCRVH